MNCLSRKRQREMLQEKKNSQTISETTTAFICFIDTAMGSVLREKCGFGAKRLNQFYRKSYDMLCEIMAKYSGDGDDDREQVELSYYVFVNNLKAIGVDADAELKKIRDAKNIFCGSAPTQKIADKRDFRRLYVKQAEIALNTYILATMWYLYEEYGYGEKKLKSVLEAFVDEYEKFIVNYIKATPENDAKCTEEINAKIDEMEKIGVVFVATQSK